MSINDNIRDNERTAGDLARLVTLRDVRKVLYMAGHFEAARLVEEMEGREAGPPMVPITEGMRQGAVGPYMTPTAIVNSARLLGGWR